MCLNWRRPGATRLIGGCTAHTLFGIPVEGDEDAPEEVRLSTISASSRRGERLKQTQVFIIDEVGMLHVNALSTINDLLKDLHDTSNRYGKALFIFSGDERQLMPILKHADPLGRAQAQASFFFSGDFRHCRVTTLTQNMRVRPGQEQYLNWQRNVGMDRYQHVRFPHDFKNRFTRYIAIPRQFARFDEASFVHEIFNPEVLATFDPMQITERVILAPTNKIVDRLNTAIGEMLLADRPCRTYLSTNVADAYDLYDPQSAVFSAENLQNINHPKLPAHRLTLKVGMPVMCMQNLNVPGGICNGTMMAVERLENDIVWCRVNTSRGQILYPVVPTHFTYKKGGFGFTRTQLPLRVAFSATINRAQGGSYDRVAYHGLHPVWQHGAFYTAATRSRSADGFTVLCDPTLTYNHNGEELPTTRNVVHPWISGRTDTIDTNPPEPSPPPDTPGSSRDDEPIDEDQMYDGPEFAFYDAGPVSNRHHDSGQAEESSNRGEQSSAPQ